MAAPSAACSSSWDAAAGILRTRCPGRVSRREVDAWRRGLHTVAWEIPPGTPFRLLFDQSGYETGGVGPEVHRLQREVIPVFLAMHRFRTVFLDFFGIEGDIAPARREAVCVAAAHVHDDCDRMALYRQNLGGPRESFFCDAAAAEAWLRSLPLPPPDSRVAPA